MWIWGTDISTFFFLCWMSWNSWYQFNSTHSSKLFALILLSHLHIFVSLSFKVLNFFLNYNICVYVATHLTWELDHLNVYSTPCRKKRGIDMLILYLLALHFTGLIIYYSTRTWECDPLSGYQIWSGKTNLPQHMARGGPAYRYVHIWLRCGPQGAQWPMSKKEGKRVSGL